MYSLVFTGLLAILFSLRTPNRITPNIYFAFLPILIFLAFRYDYGNDYLAYLDIFDDLVLNSTSISDLQYWHVEPGWVFLNNLFAPFGFYTMVAIISLTTTYIYATTIKEYVVPKYYWLAIFLYVFVPDNLLIQASAIRQSLSIAIVVWSFRYLVQARLLLFVGSVMLASTFHASSLIILPFYFVRYLMPCFNKNLVVPAAMLYISLFFFAPSITNTVFNLELLNKFETFSNYIKYDNEGTPGSGIGIIVQGIYLCMLTYFSSSLDFKHKLVIAMSAIGVLTIPFSVHVGMIYRIGFYFTIFNVLSIPILLRCIKSGWWRFVILIICISYYLVAFVRFHLNENWHDKFYYYKTIFSVVI